MSVKDKVIWLTGASSGIGEALTYELAKLGSRLIISSRRKEELEKVKSQCPKESQGKISILTIDLAQSGTLDSKTQEAISTFGHIDMLINNGGISQRSLGKETSEEVDRRIMEVNYFGTIALTKYLLPHFLERGNGHFVTVSSLVGKFGTPFRSAYSASKHALHGFYDSLRAELFNDNIDITLVCPGFIHTNVSINALTGSGKELGEMDDAQAKGMPADVFARKMIKAVEKKKREVNIGGKEKYGVLLKRFFPGLFAKAVQKAKVR
ncbi:MAG: SDR family oxidoreductase [Bacteroidota bacterium]